MSLDVELPIGITGFVAWIKTSLATWIDIVITWVNIWSFLSKPPFFLCPKSALVHRAINGSDKISKGKLNITR